jgi:carbon storage regulator
MLILTRRSGEKIMIGNDIKITVMDFIKNQIRIGIDAPKNISIHREEVYKRIQIEDVKY